MSAQSRPTLSLGGTVSSKIGAETGTAGRVSPGVLWHLGSGHDGWGAAGGLGLAYAFLIARRLIDRRVRSVKHVEDATGASVLGIIPKEDALDRGLNDRKYIVPGLGDFGDRLYGT